MLKMLTILLLISNNAVASCQYALNACNAYVKALENDNSLLKDKVSILEKEVKEVGKGEVKTEQPRGTTDGILVAGGVGVGAAAVAVGAPLVAVGVGLGALVFALLLGGK
jgi:hypothetical protein